MGEALAGVVVSLVHCSKWLSRARFWIYCLQLGQLSVEVATLTLVLGALAHDELHLAGTCTARCASCSRRLVPFQEAHLHRRAALARHELVHFVHVLLALVLGHRRVAVLAVPVHARPRQRECIVCAAIGTLRRQLSHTLKSLPSTWSAVVASAPVAVPLAAAGVAAALALLGVAAADGLRVPPPLVPACARHCASTRRRKVEMWMSVDGACELAIEWAVRLRTRVGDGKWRDRA